MKTPLILMDWMDNYGHSYPTKSLLYIQCNSHQNANVIFTETETNEQNPKIHLEAQIPDSESNLRGKRQMLFFLSFVDLRFLYMAINQVSILGMKVKLKLSMETNRTARDGRGGRRGRGKRRMCSKYSKYLQERGLEKQHYAQ